MSVQDLIDVAALTMLGLFVILMVVFAYLGSRIPWTGLRSVPAIARLRHAIGLAVEDGTRLHVSLGRGGLTDVRAAASFAGLSVLSRVARTAAFSDRPPVVSTGDGALSLLATDTFQAAFRDLPSEEAFDPDSVRLTGVTNFSYAAGAIPIISEEDVSTNILIGHFGSEMIFITDASEQHDGFVLAGTDGPTGQSIAYAAAQEPLIGEEVFATGAYLRAGAMHKASLLAQDVLRWLIIGFILVGSLFQLIQAAAR
jgi:hypothetical protein